MLAWNGPVSRESLRQMSTSLSPLPSSRCSLMASIPLIIMKESIEYLSQLGSAECVGCASAGFVTYLFSHQIDELSAVAKVTHNR